MEENELYLRFEKVGHLKHEKNFKQMRKASGEERYTKQLSKKAADISYLLKFVIFS